MRNGWTANKSRKLAFTKALTQNPFLYFRPHLKIWSLLKMCCIEIMKK
jgi:hypothetical protein